MIVNNFSNLFHIKMINEKEYFKLFWGRYEISNYGTLRRLADNNTYVYANPYINDCGYKTVKIYKKHFSIHSIVAYVFIGQRPQNFVIDHKDRHKLNNHVNNLKYVTYKENSENTDYTEYFRTNGTLNKRICNEKRKQQKQEVSKKYYEKYKEYIKKKSLEYRDKHKEQIKLQHQKYYQKVLKQKRKQQQTCVCGSVLAWGIPNRHFKTKKHIDFVAKNNA
ncbi:MAG: HNH endonuclease [Anaerolineaceae bacterium]|nr:HNH endonuclease [Anaerolineaceae bacterium]